MQEEYLLHDSFSAQRQRKFQNAARRSGINVWDVTLRWLLTKGTKRFDEFIRATNYARTLRIVAQEEDAT